MMVKSDNETVFFMVGIFLSIDRKLQLFRYFIHLESWKRKNWKTKHIHLYIIWLCVWLQSNCNCICICMAGQLSKCCSSTPALSASKFHHESSCFSNKFIVIPKKSHSSRWVSKICSRNHQRKHFELKYSNGYPLNAVAFQNGNLSWFSFFLSFFYLYSWCLSCLVSAYIDNQNERIKCILQFDKLDKVNC